MLRLGFSMLISALLSFINDMYIQYTVIHFPLQLFLYYTYRPFKFADLFYLVGLYIGLLYPKFHNVLQKEKKIITWSFPSLRHGPHFSLHHQPLPSCKHLQGPGIKIRKTLLMKATPLKMFASFWAKAGPKSDIPLWSGQLVASSYSCAL